MDIFLNRKQWEMYSPCELVAYRERIFHHYRSKGFPYISQSPEYRAREWNKFTSYSQSVFEDGLFRQVMHGLSLSWSYFPHAFDVKCGDFLTPMDVFKDDNLFRKAIDTRLKIGTYISDSGIRKMLRIFSGTQSVSNFRPTVARDIYNLFADNGTVWDMSCGWGGRLIGFLNSKAVKYIGTEPASKTFEGLKEISRDFNNGRIVDLYCQGSENEVPIPDSSVDLCFTSPPYYDWEKYDDSDCQSYKAYPDKDSWLNGFLKNTFKNCHRVLKDNKYMVINIANTRNYKTLEDDCVKVAKEIGFSLEKNWFYLLSKMPQCNKSSYKSEPIFVFRKV